MPHFLTILIAFIFLSCTSSAPKSADDSSERQNRSAIDTIKVEKIQIANPAEYLSVLDTLDRGDLSSLYVAATIFKNSQTDSLTCDSLFSGYYDFLKLFAQRYLENNQKAGTELIHSRSVGAFERLKSSLSNYEIHLDSLDGSYSLEPNNGCLLLKFGDRLTTAYRSFLALRSWERTRWMAGGSQYVIPHDSLAARIILWENFIHQHPTFVSIREAQEQYTQSLGDFLAGTNHSVVFDPETYLLIDSSRVAFESLILKNPESESAEIVKAYLGVLEATDYRYSEKIDSFLLKKVFAAEFAVDKN